MDAGTVTEGDTYAEPGELRVVLPGLLLAMTLAALDQNIVGTALPRIVSDLGGLNQLSWVVSAFMLASTATTPLYGKLSDIYGRRPLFVIAISIFLVGSMLCGAAQSMLQLILFRGVQGLGAGGLMTLAQTTIADLISPRDRGRYQGLFGAVFAASSVAGPLLGGLLTDLLSWRWIFYVNLPVGAAALALIMFGLRRPPPDVKHRIDYVGAVLLTGSTTAVLLALSWGGSVYPWSSPVILGLGGMVLLQGAGLVWQERRFDEPILPGRLMGNRVFQVASAVIAMNMVALYGAMVFMPLFFQLVMSESASRSGLLMAPLMAGVIISAIIGGRLMTRTGRYKPFTVGGLAVAAVTLGVMARTAQSGASLPVVEFWLIVLGLSLGFVMPNLTVAIQNAVPLRDMGVATSAAAFFRTLGGSVGVALSGGLLNASLQSSLLRAGFSPEETQQALSQGLQQLGRLSAEHQEVLVQAYRQGIGANYWGGAAVAGVAFLFTLMLPELPLKAKSTVIKRG